MALALRDQLSFCIIEQHVLFLDVANDRYFGVRESTSSALLCMMAGKEIDRVAPGLRALLDQGYLVEKDCHTRLSPSVHPIARIDCAVIERIPTAADIARAVVALGHSALLLKYRRLHLILESIRRRKSGLGPRRRPARSLAIAGALKTLGSVFGQHERCLLYSLALAKLLLSSGTSPTLIFGVKLAPFAAHCWVQDGDCVLNDDLDHTRLFTPILSI
ncbi:hypothetical protein Sj15T_10470 [Sphingobium sp. TA15]|uniref:Microcin J25-processing protein McjB C-terminal domain-containing protein n=1 Tax=Sphingobium indicum (strain DSM 16413 / CCM 7287 / MTCC 6362 / UT26 / NBRC 101211 / UT26S) TaxID=452662 RepID=D4Z8W5_SPHIU|nr:lasso peptide biosynthesis B2 protein [Sphingobium indicum]BAI99047.1 hypothetical protein SJA_P1-00950 [Sphingobium indicum UT26S]BDD66026.1 hypothetical protein Sj15T_10470 [Sphingobium sp. TA15]